MLLKSGIRNLEKNIIYINIIKTTGGDQGMHDDEDGYELRNAEGKVIISFTSPVDKKIMNEIIEQYLTANNNKFDKQGFINFLKSQLNKKCTNQ